VFVAVWPMIKTVINKRKAANALAYETKAEEKV
jgi:hypothetical protein